MRWFWLSLLGACGAGEVVVSEGEPVDWAVRQLRHNSAPHVPPACYANTRSDRNPCSACHTRGRRPNFVDDFDLQVVAAFPEPAWTNHWDNLWADRRKAVAGISDDQILAWVRQDNSAIVLPGRWDTDGDGEWLGFSPDAAFDFDAEGFDREDGRLTGWRAYAYRPFPGFFPTNGNWGDALIRLPEAYRTDAQGRDDLVVYKLNLAILESMLHRADVPIATVDERALAVDLDRDGKLGMADRVVYDWNPREGRVPSWVGQAARSDVEPPTAGLYPVGTEFLHSVRYLDVVDGQVQMAPRMKELRYLTKTTWQTYSDLESAADGDAREREQFPDRLEHFQGHPEAGLFNGLGWRIQGFIEDADGDLRPQTWEETGYCVGCHGGIGAGDDSVLSFGRKVPGDAGWGNGTPYGLAEPIRADGRGEYSAYLAVAGGADDFAANDEVRGTWFDEGALTDEAIEALGRDVSKVIVPTPLRALELNKAYRVIQLEQSYVHGRDAAWGLSEDHVHREVTEAMATGVSAIEPPIWIRPRG